MNNKRKIINDPVYGFITIPDEVVFDVLEHPYFQRLRRIKQLGLTHLVYPGALHTRFHHALGAMHLMQQAVATLRWKGIPVTEEEERGVLLAVLLHDIGHGPFSHALENCLVFGMSHEDLSHLFMERLNVGFRGVLGTAIRIFSNDYPKKFLHQLVSGQLDMDRMDYLKRDSFFTGVSEGVINSDRLINMLTVLDDQLVIEAKGIYSVEKFIVARRLMYWQVYLHKTVLAAEQMLIHILRRAKFLAERGHPLFATPALAIFLGNRYGIGDFRKDPALLDAFAELDDSDISASVKVWTRDDDRVLSRLCTHLAGRQLFRIRVRTRPFSAEELGMVRGKVRAHYGLRPDETDYFVFHGEIANNAYNPLQDKIFILHKEGSLSDIATDSSQINVSVLSETITNYYLCYPKEIDPSIII